MNPVPSPLRSARRRGFTLVEVALCIGIIGFALVAIIGILPAGLRVQQENREDTLINQDAQYLIEAIRSGAGSAAANVLTNFVDSIDTGGVLYSNAAGPNPFYTGREIVGLMSRPTTNDVRLRNISGTASDLSPAVVAKDFAFRYLVQVRVKPIERQVTVIGPPPTNAPTLVLVTNHHELVMDFRWPLLPNGGTGAGRKTFRTQIAGTLQESPPVYWFFNPQSFTP
jgi:type II secretory pathway pseudopilin PulG